MGVAAGSRHSAGLSRIQKKRSPWKIRAGPTARDGTDDYSCAHVRIASSGVGDVWTDIKYSGANALRVRLIRANQSPLRRGNCRITRFRIGD
jgi:hypothetical protein